MRTVAVRRERVELTIRMITKLFSFTFEKKNITTLEVTICSLEVVGVTFGLYPNPVFQPIDLQFQDYF